MGVKPRRHAACRWAAAGPDIQSRGKSPGIARVQVPEPREGVLISDMSEARPEPRGRSRREEDERSSLVGYAPSSADTECRSRARSSQRPDKQSENRLAPRSATVWLECAPQCRRKGSRARTSSAGAGPCRQPLSGPQRRGASSAERESNMRVTVAKKNPVDHPHMRIPVNASTPLSSRHSRGSTMSPYPVVV